MIGSPDPEALFVALTLAPGTYSRNRFFELFESLALRGARRRARLVLSIVSDLQKVSAAPASSDEPDYGLRERPFGDEVELSYRMSGLDYRRTTILTRLEVATLRYALCRARGAEPADVDRTFVESTLARMDPRRTGG